MPVKEAIAQATAVRFRPIFLTKVVALGSLLPLAIFSPFWRGLTSVIIAGILTSGVLSLFTTPILYTWFDGLAARSGRNRELRGSPPRFALPQFVADLPQQHQLRISRLFLSVISRLIAGRQLH
jgi:hypothetical protein